MAHHNVPALRSVNGATDAPHTRAQVPSVTSARLAEAQRQFDTACAREVAAAGVLAEARRDRQSAMKAKCEAGEIHREYLGPKSPRISREELARWRSTRGGR